MRLSYQFWRYNLPPAMSFWNRVLLPADDDDGQGAVKQAGFKSGDKYKSAYKLKANDFLSQHTH